MAGMATQYMAGKKIKDGIRPKLKQSKVVVQSSHSTCAEMYQDINSVLSIIVLIISHRVV
jgi:hypothetical protein